MGILRRVFKLLIGMVLVRSPVTNAAEPPDVMATKANSAFRNIGI